MRKGEGPGEIIDPISITIDQNNYIYIADNSTRRVSIYDSNKVFKNSFIISGGHIVPISMKAEGNFIYMGGYRMLDKTLIHKYSLSGKYINSFMKVPRELKNSKLGSSICYPFFDISNNQICATEAILYQIYKFNFDGKIQELFKIVPDYYVSLTDEIISEFNKTLDTGLLLKFSKPNFIACVDSLILVQIEMPRDEYESGNYFRGAEYRIDIFKEKSKDIICSGIKSTYPLYFINKRDNLFYFVSELNYSENKYCINFFKL